MKAISKDRLNLESSVERHQLDRTDAIALLISSILAGLVCYLIAFDRYFFSQSALPLVRQEIAEITSSAEGVKHRRAEIPLWQKSSTHQSLADQDQVFTGPTSRAEISFRKTNTVIELEPNSLVVVRDEAESKESNWFRGLLSSDSTPKNTVLEINGRKAEFSKGARVQIASTNDGNTTIKVIAGEVLIKDEHNKVVEVLPNQIASLSEKSEVAAKIEPLTLTLSAPAYGEKIVVNPIRPIITLKWSTSTKQATDYRVEISAGPSFTSTATTSTLTTVPSTTFQPPSAGKYYWRITPLASPAQSVVSQFEVIANNPPRLVFPFQDAEFQLQTSRPQSIVMRWESGGVDNFKIQVATEPHFVDLIADSHTTLPASRMEHKIAGKYYWRVGSIHDSEIVWSATQIYSVLAPPKRDADSEPISSTDTPVVTPPLSDTTTQPKAEPTELSPVTKSVQLTQSPESVPPKPELVPPPIAAPVLKSNPNLSISDPDNLGVELNLAWDPIPAVTEYEVQFSDEQNFAVIKSSKQIASNEIKVTAAEATRFWRVRAYHPRALWSQTGSVNVLASSPLSITAVSERQVQLSWQSDRPGEGLLTVTDNSTEQEVTSYKLRGRMGEVVINELPPGEYRVHAQVTTKDEHRFASRVAHFSIAKTSPVQSEPLFQADLSFAPFGSMFNQRSQRDQGEEYSSTDFSAGLDASASMAKGSWLAKLNYQYEYAKYFLIDKDQSPQTVENHAFAIGGGYEFNLKGWLLAPQLLYLSKDFATVRNADNQLSVEKSSAQWLALAFSITIPFDADELSFSLLQSIVPFSSSDAQSNARLTSATVQYFQTVFRSSIRMLYGLDFKTFHVDLDNGAGFTEISAISALLGLSYQF